MRVALYTQISTDEAHQPYSLEAQSVKLKAYIESQDGWHLTREITDQSSGAKTDRPGLQQALREARAGRFDLLLVYRVNRFSRSVRGLGNCSKTSMRPSWHSVPPPKPSTPRRLQVA
jgi:site-specific DNA recombinase